MSRILVIMFHKKVPKVKIISIIFSILESSEKYANLAQSNKQTNIFLLWLNVIIGNWFGGGCYVIVQSHMWLETVKNCNLCLCCLIFKRKIEIIGKHTYGWGRYQYHNEFVNMSWVSEWKYRRFIRGLRVWNRCVEFVMKSEWW